MAIVVTSESSVTYKATIHRLNQTFPKMSDGSGNKDQTQEWLSLQNIHQEQNNKIKEDYSNPNGEGKTDDEPKRKKMKRNKECDKVRDHSPGEVNVNSC